MLALMTGSTEHDAVRSSKNWNSFDPQPGSRMVIFKDGNAPFEKNFVRIVLVDWSSELEVEALEVDNKAIIEPFVLNENNIPNILVIGDSISSGYAAPIDQGGEPVPYGVLNAFPLVAQQILREKEPPIKINVDLLAYPGLTLVQPTEQEIEKNHPPGIVEAFFWKSPWDRQVITPKSSPTAVLIEYGTNDQFYNIPKERFADELVVFIAKLIEKSADSIQHIWLIPPFPDSDSENRELNLAMPYLISRLESKFGNSPVAEGRGIAVKLCDINDGLTVEDTVDGVHPRLTVQREIGKKLAEFIQRNLNLNQ